MAEFSRLIITNKGQALLAKMIAGSGNIEFTKISSSSTAYTDTQLEGLTALTSMQQTSLISKVTHTNEVAIKVEAVFTNTELKTGYYMKALGLYAVDPDEGEILYAVTRETSGNCYMPAYNGTTVSGAYVQLITTVGNAENVSLEVNEAAVATIGDIKRIEEYLERIDGDSIKIAGKGWIYQENTREGALKSLSIEGNTTVIKVNEEEQINPDNPAQISGIGENRAITLMVANQNLCQLSSEDITTTANGVTVKYTAQNQEIELNGTITKTGYCMRSEIIPISVQEGENFVFWLKLLSGGISANSIGCFSVEFLNQEHQKVQPRTYYDLNFGSNHSGSVRISKKAAEQITGYQISVYARTVGGGFQAYTFRAQLQKGVQTDWEASRMQQLQIPLESPMYSLPNGICDSIEKRGESWGVVRRVGKGVFRETNRIAKDARFDTEETILFKIYFPMPNKLITRNDFNLYCNFFYAENIYDQSGKEGAYTTDGLWIRMKKSRVENTEDATLLEWAKTGGGSEGFVLYEMKEQFEEFEPEIQTKLNQLRSKDGSTNLILSEPAPIHVDFYNHIKTATEELIGNIQELQRQITDLQDFLGYSYDDIFGVEVDFVNKKFTRLANAVDRAPGKGFNLINAFGGRRRCNVKDDGTVTAYYGDSNYTTTGKNADGDWVQVMVEQPKFYYKVVPIVLEKGVMGMKIRKARYYVSDTLKPGFKIHPAFVENGNVNSYIYLAAFEGSLFDTSANAYISDNAQVADFAADKLSSIADVKPIGGDSQNLTRANTRLLAKKRGAGWEQAYAATVAASQLLMLIEYASFDMQSEIGTGYTQLTGSTSGNLSMNTGQTVGFGNDSGAHSLGIQGKVNIVSYRGEENFWGNVWTWVDGMNEENPEPFTEGQIGTLYVADHAFVDNSKASPYKNTDIHPVQGSGYISAFGYSEEFDWLFIGVEYNGNSALPVGDYTSNQNPGWRAAELGGYCKDGYNAGAFYWNLNNAASTHGWSIGGRLVYIPSKKST